MQDDNSKTNAPIIEEAIGNEPEKVKEPEWCLKILCRLRNLLYSSPDGDHEDISGSEEYYAQFGIEQIPLPLKEGEPQRYTLKVKDGFEKKVDAAYQKAYENRNLEIGLFWSRGTYFWGFIVVVFSGYFLFISSDKVKNVEGHEYISLMLICLGLILSIAWTLAIKGSKHWQENWEKHIDMLEDVITGPLFKTINYRGKFHSVSKISEIISWVVTWVWVGLLWNNLGMKVVYCFTTTTDCKPDFYTIAILFITIYFWIKISLGHARKDFDNSEGFIKRHLDPLQKFEKNKNWFQKLIEKC